MCRNVRESAPRRESLDFADEAFWDPYAEDRNVRDGNLVMWVTLTGDRHPYPDCEPKAVSIAEAVLSAMPR